MGNINVFKLYFEKDLKTLGIKKYTVCKILGCTMPTLSNRVNNPGKFTVDEIETLKENGFIESMQRLI